MLEMLSIGKTGNIVSDFIYNGEVVGPTYTQVNDAMGFVGGTRYQGDAYVSFTEVNTGDVWYIAKAQTIANIDHSVLDAAGGFRGKNITISGAGYFARTLYMTRDGFTSADVRNGGSVTYSANSTFAFSEFNKIFYQILGLNGASVEGIQYGTAAKFTAAQLGFHQNAGGALIGAEVNPDGYRIVQAAGWTTRLSRKLASPYHGWRPMLKVLGESM
ncbi:hypothetical protein SPLA5a_PHROGS00196 [Salmonella phage SPLA5a]|nr:hypothetical protein SPLA5a_PHROGS00196 [Salmonella phage SPLA5a]